MRKLGLASSLLSAVLLLGCAEQGDTTDAIDTAAPPAAPKMVEPAPDTAEPATPELQPESTTPEEEKPAENP